MFQEIKKLFIGLMKKAVGASFRISPNKLKSGIIKGIVNTDKKLKRIAEILDLELDKGSVFLKFILKGESEPITVSLNYTLEDNSILITKVETNKEWIKALAEVFSKINLNIFGKDADLVKDLIKSI